MIDARELRIGNYIFWNIPQKKGVPHRIIGILERSLHTVPISIPDSRDVEEYEPIPLTPELLEKCGVDTASNETVFKEKYLTAKNRGIHFFFRNNILEYSTVHSCNKTHIKYLHQLQNLFYCLTGKELEVNF